MSPPLQVPSEELCNIHRWPKTWRWELVRLHSTNLSITWIKLNPKIPVTFQKHRDAHCQFISVPLEGGRLLVSE